MPRTTIAPVSVSRSGVGVHAAAFPANVDVANGNAIANDGKLHVLFRTGASTDVLTATLNPVDGVTVTKNISGTQAINTEFLYGPFPVSVYGSTLQLSATNAASAIIPIVVSGS